MQLLSLIPILILLLYLLVSIDLVYTGICALSLKLVQKENNCSLRFIQIVLVLKLQGENRSKIAQKPLKSCLKNRSKITARNERFFKQDLSGLSGFSKKTAQTAQTAQTTQILLENRSNRSNLERFLSGISTRERHILLTTYY